PQLGGPQAPQGAPPQPQQPLRLSGPPQKQAPPYAYSVDLVKRLKEDNNFQNIIKQGFDPLTTADVLRAVLKKEHVTRILDKAPGGMDKVVADYTQYLQEQKQQEQFSAAIPKEPYDDRVQFINPSRVIKMQGPEVPQQAQQQAPPQVEAQQQAEMEAPQQAQIGPGRQRLQGLMDKLKAARGENTITPVQPATASMPQELSPTNQPLSTVPSYPVLPPAPKNLPTPAPKAASKKAEKPKAKRATKAEKEEKTRSEYQEKKKDIKDRLDNAREREKAID
ncbi:MAG: hypothetical protein LW696_07710, partial [Alphaproteobacteria bacterium]|nr:hypothetical protein [Alphaproteobacteria bacterium]